MNIISDIFKNDEAYREAYQARQGRQGQQGRRQPKCRLFPPGARLVRI